MVRDKDWERIQRRLRAAKNQRKEFSAAGWTFLGVLAGSVLAGMVWEPAYRAMSPELRPEFAWIWPAFVATDIGAGILSAGAFWAARVTGDAEAASIDEILEDMAEIQRVTEAQP